MPCVNEPERRESLHQPALVALLFLAAALVGAAPAARGDEETATEITHRHRFVTEIPVPSAQATWFEFQIPPSMFDGSRWDLGDLRLLDANDSVVPYAIRVRQARSSRQPITATEFNRGTTPERAAEISLDLGPTPIDHNEVQVSTAGSEFRRQATLEGSADGQAWNKIAEKQLLRFHRAMGSLDDDRFEYSAGRFRYLRVRVSQDPQVDHGPVEVTAVAVRRTVEVPGEMVSFEAQLGPRETGRQNGVSGSWWPVDLGGTQVPCQRLEVEIEGTQFVRNYVVTPLADEARQETTAIGEYWSDGPRGRGVVPVSDDAVEPNLSQAFGVFAGERGEWRRRPGEPLAPLVADLGNVRAGKLRLFIEDSANQPLQATSVKYVAPACVVVVAGSPAPRGPLRAYFGDAGAEPPNYDFARNLPAKLDPPPARVEAGERMENAAYIPPPKPFTERFRWLIHGLLGVVSLLLAALVFQLARQVVARHDARAAAPNSTTI